MLLDNIKVPPPGESTPVISFHLDPDGEYKVKIDRYENGAIQVTYSSPHQPECSMICGNGTVAFLDTRFVPSYFDIFGPTLP